MEVFYQVQRVPVHSVLLLPTRDEAIRYPQGDIDLALCHACGFIGNTAFDASLHEYSTRYEETQGFSPTFRTFHEKLARTLVEEFDLRDKTVIEIGCGKGEFLTMLCEFGNNRGVGFDPAYVSERNTSAAKDRITFITDLYSEKYTGYHGDFVCCKMTLEHIPATADFMRTVRTSIGDRRETVVFFQIPEVRRILAERAFWDIYYEHCSYFTKGSLARLFRRAGFTVRRLWTDYDDQYLMIEARPGNGAAGAPLPEEDDLALLEAEVRDFTRAVDGTLARWKKEMDEHQRAGHRVVLWGGGSKGVAFLTKLGIRDQVQYVVDINPYKHGSFMAGTGQEIVGPQFLTSYKPDLVVVMNPIYMEEIRAEIARVGVTTTVVPIVQEHGA
jgi:SAM-dependent methyltransferase